MKVIQLDDGYTTGADSSCLIVTAQTFSQVQNGNNLNAANVVVVAGLFGSLIIMFTQRAFVSMIMPDGFRRETRTIFDFRI